MFASLQVWSHHPLKELSLVRPYMTSAPKQGSETLSDIWRKIFSWNNNKKNSPQEYKRRPPENQRLSCRQLYFSWVINNYNVICHCISVIQFPNINAFTMNTYLFREHQIKRILKKSTGTLSQRPSVLSSLLNVLPFLFLYFLKMCLLHYLLPLKIPFWQ